MEIVTPAKAEKWLNSNKANRKLREGVAEKYAEDMANGKWTQCPVPISFYEDGDIADGQHRLFAIIESNTSQRFLIYHGLSRAAGLNLDTGLGRTLVDNARISGDNSDLSNELISLARAIEEGTRQIGGRSNAKRLELVNKHDEAARWAVANGPRSRGLRSAITLGAVARAYYHEKDKDKLKRFCEVVNTGFSDGRHESAAVAIRNYIMASKAGRASNSPALWRETFLKVQNAINYFMKGKALTVIKVVSEEAYPLKKKRSVV
jgi:hypothetical protein